MIDEIHIKPYMDYKGGNIIGNAYNSSECANRAHVFMVNSLLSDYKDVVHILPVKTLNNNCLFQYIKNIIIELENIGYKVLAVVSDNNSINKKAMSYFVRKSKKLCKKIMITAMTTQGRQKINYY